MLSKTAFAMLGVGLLAAACLAAADKNADERAARRRALAAMARPDAVDLYSARRPGNWDGDIWCLRRANMGDPLGDVVRRARPHGGANAEINAPVCTVTVSKPAAAANFRIMRDRGKLVIDKGGALVLEKGYDGQGNGKTDGEVWIREGGAWTVKGRFCAAGINAVDSGVGTVTQDGGRVSVSGTLFLTGPLPLSSSAQATGVYRLNGGTLFIEAPEGRPALADGIGHNRFEFGAGTLAVNACAIDLNNTRGGNLSPAGDDALGETRLMSDAPRTYTQGDKSRLTINVAGRARHDRLVWRGARGARGTVVFEDGAVIRLVGLKNYRFGSGDVFDVVEADAVEVRGRLVVETERGETFSHEVLPEKNGQKLRLKYGR